MRGPPARVIYSSLFFALTMVLIAVAKPPALFDPATGMPRAFGHSRGTVFSFGVVTVVAAVLSMYVFSMIDLVTRT